MKRMLSLLRHAKSDWSDGALSDHERPLNARGREACVVMAAHMQAQNLTPGLVLCSDARRTQETLERIQSALPADTPVRVEPDLYLASPATIQKQIETAADDIAHVLVIAHYPGVAEAALMLGKDDPHGLRESLRQKYPTAGLCCLDLYGETWARALRQKGALFSYSTPKTLLGKN